MLDRPCTTCAPLTGPHALLEHYRHSLDLLTLYDAENIIGVKASTLRHQIRNGSLKARKVGPVWTVTAGELERYAVESMGRPGRHAAAR